MRLRILSWGGDTSIAEDGTDYQAYLPDESTGIFSQVGANPEFLTNAGQSPTFLNTIIDAWYFPIKIKITNRTDAGNSSMRDALAKKFPTTLERNQEQILLCKDIDDTDKEWQVTGAPIQFKFKKDFVTIIIAVAEPRFVETDEQSDSDTYATGAGVTLDPEPKGNTEFDPILEITPTSQRTTGNSGEEIEHFVEIVNPAGQPALTGFAIDLSDGGWSHSTDVGTSDSLANGDDIRVEINGQTVNRWIDGANTASAQLWTHIDLPASKILKLGVALSGGGSETEVQLEATIPQYTLLQSMPVAGQFKIGTERFTYTGKNIIVTNGILQFTGVKRGVLQSSKAAHSISASITWIPNIIWVRQGDTTVVDSPNTSGADNFKPAFELNSTNTQWIYDTVFFDASQRRSWRFNNLITLLSPTPDNLTVGESQIFTADENTFADPASVLGQRMAAINDPNSSGYTNMSATLSANLEIPFGIKAVTVEGRKAYNGSDWVLEHSLWYSRGNGDWTQKWNDSTAPAASNGTWENLAGSIEATLHTLDASNGYRHIIFMQKGAISGGTTQSWDAWQIDKCTLDFNSGEVPAITSKFTGYGGGTAIAELKYVISNSATGDSIEVNAVLEINDTIILNFQTFDFYILSNNIKLPVSVRPTGAITGHWFRLMGGEANTITITDVNMPTTTMVVKWNARQI